MANEITGLTPPEDTDDGDIIVRIVAEVMTVVFDIWDWITMYYNDIFEEQDWYIGRRKSRGSTDYGQYNSPYGLGHERIDIDIPKLRLILRNLRELYQIRARGADPRYFGPMAKIIRSLNEDNLERRAKALDKVLQLAGESLNPNEALLCSSICQFFVDHPIVMSQVIPRVAQMERERRDGSQ